MANLDVRSRRASSIGVLLPFVLAPVLPDGIQSAADRAHTAWSYGGLLSQVAGTQVVTVVLPGETLSIPVVASEALAVPSFCVEALAVPSHRAEVLSL